MWIEVIDVETQQATDFVTTESSEARSSTWLWAAPAVGLLLVIGIVVWAWSSGGGDDQPTLTFDGTATTYSGPDPIEAGEVTFLLKNESGRDVVFVWGRHTRDDVTEEETMAWVEENPSTAPPWVAEAQDIGPTVPAGTSVEQTSELRPGRTDLLVFDEIAYPAVIIEVTDSD